MKKTRKRELFALIGIIILAVVLIFSATRLFKAFDSENTQNEVLPPERKTITRDGVDYFPRQDIEVFLLMGIDREGPVEDSGSYRNEGMADTVVLLIFDQTAEEIRVLSLNRDSMVEMPVLGIGGRRAGTDYAQLALAHTYGSGLEDSCENLRETVSDLLYGITIDHYISLNMDAIAIVNDAVGGVRVTVTDDFSEVSDLPMGEVLLKGQQAVDFVRLRKGVGDQLNLSRMERQSEYMEGFLAALQSKLDESSTFPLSVYEDVSPYMVTDCSGTVFSSVVERYADYELVEVASLQGENVRGEEYMEYHLDEEALDELIIRLLYAEKK